jgi:tRNA pseudouridine55 synthase
MRRDISGVLLLDKPIDITSNKALQLCKRIFSANKAGHTGSLDPIATGMLPICFGEATKFSRFLLDADKHYIVKGKLGEITASADRESEVIEKREVKNIDEDVIEKILPNFRGKILQIPPMYSALKHQGRPLYELARQGIEIERQQREVTIKELKLLDLNNELVELEVRCSKGTYIRTLIADMGVLLGCGAHVIELRRLAVDSYQPTQMIDLNKLYKLQQGAENNDYEELDKLLLPIDSMLHSMPEVILTDDMVYYMYRGQAVLVLGVPSFGLVKMKTKNGDFFGVGEVTPDGKITPRRLCNIKFMRT